MLFVDEKRWFSGIQPKKEVSPWRCEQHIKRSKGDNTWFARYKMTCWLGRRKYLELGGARHVEGTFPLRRKGHFLIIKRALLCSLYPGYVHCKTFGGASPQCPPVPTSMCAGRRRYLPGFLNFLKACSHTAR